MIANIVQATMSKTGVDTLLSKPGNALFCEIDRGAERRHHITMMRSFCWLPNQGYTGKYDDFYNFKSLSPRYTYF
jgi:hypothetical protein